MPLGGLISRLILGQHGVGRRDMSDPAVGKQLHIMNMISYVKILGDPPDDPSDEYLEALDKLRRKMDK